MHGRKLITLTLMVILTSFLIVAIPTLGNEAKNEMEHYRVEVDSKTELNPKPITITLSRVRTTTILTGDNETTVVTVTDIIMHVLDPIPKGKVRVRVIREDGKTVNLLTRKFYSKMAITHEGVKVKALSVEASVWFKWTGKVIPGEPELQSLAPPSTEGQYIMLVLEINVTKDGKLVDLREVPVTRIEKDERKRIVGCRNRLFLNREELEELLKDGAGEYVLSIRAYGYYQPWRLSGTVILFWSEPIVIKLVRSDAGLSLMDCEAQNLSKISQILMLVIAIMAVLGFLTLRK